MVNNHTSFFLFVLVAFFFSSCQPTKKTHLDRLYLQGIDSSLNSAINVPEPLIQKGELLSITVFSDDADATLVFNQIQNGAGSAKSAAGEAAGGSGGGGATQGTGYLVDPEGNIRFHTIGMMHIEGLSKLQLKKLLEEKLTEFLKHPYVEIRFLSKRVTILGEVEKPGVINMPEEKLSILEALALSGDITNYGRKDNILVVREENGKRSMARLNVKDPAVYRSDYFYLHKDDLVYIEPNRKKPSGTDQTLVRNISLGASLLSVLAILYTLFKK